ncbi:MAG: 4-hydroxy-tetrahydrodipicolinate synthase [Chitinophagaceae bacterium]
MKLSEIRGTGVAIVTPFKHNGDIDFHSLEKIIHHVIEGGASSIVSLGTTGETPTISPEEKKEIINFTIEKVNDRVPVIVGIGGNNTQEIIHCMETYPLDKVLAILSVSPYYSKPSSEGLYQHYKTISAASPKPIILYNVPSRTGRNIPAEVTLRLAKDFENIVAIKEASGDMIQCMHIIKNKPDDFTVVSGDDMLAMSQVACGMEGVISVAANYMPQDMSKMIHAALENRFDMARELHFSMMKAFELIFAENNPAGIKAFLSVAGLCNNHLRLPVVPVSELLMKQIKEYIKVYRS